jgi:CRISPR/Cas system-associated exonuclease Cas4 (RecB family)
MKVSPSKINSFNTCPQQYDWNYNLKLLSIKWDALYLWVRYHELVRQYHIDWDEHKEKIGKEYELLWCYIKKPMRWTIVNTELNIKFDLELPRWDTVNVNIVLDRINENEFVDYKTTSVDYTEEDCKTIQSLLYVYWWWITYGKIYPFVFHVINKKKIGQKKYLPQEMKPVIYTEEDLKQVPTIIQQFVEKVEKGKFPATPSPRCWGCPYWPSWLDYCKDYKKWLYKK